MKGAVDLITLIIVACMVVSIGLMLWFCFSSYYSQVSQTGEARTQRSLETLSSCMRIEEATQNKFFIRNCGTGLVTNDSLNVYIDDIHFSFSLDPASIDAGKTGTLSLQGAWSLPIGQHTLRITNPNFETSIMFESELPDSCVLSLDFDEGSGTTAYDYSSFHNDGTLKNDSGVCSGISCPSWTTGKFGNALKFDGLAVGEKVEIPHSDILELGSKDYTITLWFKASDTPTLSRMLLKRREGLDSEVNLTSLYRNAGKLIFSVKNIGADKQHVQSSIQCEQDVFYNVAVGRKESNMFMFINGVNVTQSSSVTGDVPDFNILTTLDIGNDDSYYGWEWNGTIDEVRIYNRALTPDETSNFRII